MPSIADHVLDLPEHFYSEAGTSRLHSIDEFNPYAVKDGDLIFVKTDFIVDGSFEKLYLDKIFNRFNLITGVSSYHLGRDGGDKYKKILNHPNLVKWVCTNPPAEKSNKIIPLPIGFQEPDRQGGNQEMLLNVFKNRIDFKDKENKIFLPYHTPTTNRTRQESFDYLKKLPFVVFQENKQTISEYYKSLDKYKFIIGLEGSGPDIHRNYETMLVGSIPINIKSIIQDVFSFNRASGIFIDKWSNINQTLLDNMLKTSYNTKVNDDFIDLEKRISFVKEKIKIQYEI